MRITPWPPGELNLRRSSTRRARVASPVPPATWTPSTKKSPASSLKTKTIGIVQSASTRTTIEIEHREIDLHRGRFEDLSVNGRQFAEVVLSARGAGRVELIEIDARRLDHVNQLVLNRVEPVCRDDGGREVTPGSPSVNCPATFPGLSIRNKASSYA
ncbi:hypothetical protein U1Q18_052071 [Sarracenia purpurea var. burkii]